MLVGAFACAHTPQLLIRPETEDRDLVLRVHAAFARVKRRLEALRPDVLAMVRGDHIEAFFLDAVAPLAVYVGTECAGIFGPTTTGLRSTSRWRGRWWSKRLERGSRPHVYAQTRRSTILLVLAAALHLPEPALPIACRCS